MKKLYFTFAFLLSFGLATAQSSKDYRANTPDYSSKTTIDPIPAAAPPPPLPPNPIPIDGGAGCLLAVGIGLGLRKIRKSK